MNLPDSLACEQALGVWGGRGAKGGFRSLSPPPPGSLLADALLIKIGFFLFLHFYGPRRSRQQKYRKCSN